MRSFIDPMCYCSACPEGAILEEIEEEKPHSPDAEGAPHRSEMWRKPDKKLTEINSELEKAARREEQGFGSERLLDP